MGVSSDFKDQIYAEFKAKMAKTTNENERLLK